MVRHLAVAVLLVLAPGCLGGPKTPEGDHDGDFLDDAIETAGWNITVRANPIGCEPGALVPEPVVVHVTSATDRGDTDGDGLSDSEEYAFASDPRASDTDRDGLDDAMERRLDDEGKLQRAGGLFLDRADSDGDCLTDFEEIRGTAVAGLGKRTSDPTVADTDHDGLPDGREVTDTHTDPLLADTDHDGLNDFVDADPLENIGLRVTFERVRLKTGDGPLRFEWSFDGPDGSVRRTGTHTFTIANGENKTVGPDDAPGTVDVADVRAIQFQLWVTRGGSPLRFAPGSDDPIPFFVLDARGHAWTGGGRSGRDDGSLVWFTGADAELGVRVQRVAI